MTLTCDPVTVKTFSAMDICMMIIYAKFRWNLLTKEISRHSE